MRRTVPLERIAVAGQHPVDVERADPRDGMQIVDQGAPGAVRSSTSSRKRIRRRPRQEVVVGEEKPVSGCPRGTPGRAYVRAGEGRRARSLPARSCSPSVSGRTRAGSTRRLYFPLCRPMASSRGSCVLRHPCRRRGRSRRPPPDSPRRPRPRPCPVSPGWRRTGAPLSSDRSWALPVVVDVAVAHHHRVQRRRSMPAPAAAPACSAADALLAVPIPLSKKRTPPSSSSRA